MKRQVAMTEHQLVREWRQEQPNEYDLYTIFAKDVDTLIAEYDDVVQALTAVLDLFGGDNSVTARARTVIAKAAWIAAK